MSKQRVWSTAVLGAMAILALAGCTFVAPQRLVVSGRRVTVNEELSGFSKVDASSAFEVEVTSSDEYSVLLTVDEKVEPYLDVRVEGDTLHIGVQPDPTFAGASQPLTAQVSMPRLTGVALSGASNATVEGFASDERLDVDLSGASHLKGEIEAGAVRFEVSGASILTLSGAGGQTTLEVSGASQANLQQFAVADASIKLSGASRAAVNASGKIDADVSGASTLHYTGTPTMGSIKSSGGGRVEPM